jgi:serine/threonine protein phosphatase PrpC
VRLHEITIRARSFEQKRVALSPEEGFVLSRVIEPLLLADLVAVSGIAEDRLVAIVDRLASQGVLDVVENARRDTTPSPVTPEQLAESGILPVIANDCRAHGNGLADTGVADESHASGVALALCGISHIGAVRSNNEDALAVLDLTSGVPIEVTQGGTIVVSGPRGILLAVSDGMGGENAGEVASALVLDTIRAQLAAQFRDEDPAGAFAAAVHEANARVKAAGEEPGRVGMGATLVGVLISGGGTAFTAEVGDSRAYVLRIGALTRLTKDQTPVHFLIEQGVLTAEEAKRSAAQNIVLQACGKGSELVVAQRQLELRQDDRLLLCSDGLTLHVSDEEIQTILASVPSVEEACAKLIALANDRGGKDNVTVLLADVAGPLPPPQGGAGVADTLVTIRELDLASCQRLDG